jgi:4-hydroxybenzoate polyprenyltransferase
LSIKELIGSFAMCVKFRREVVIIYTWPAFLCLLFASGMAPPLFKALKLVLTVTFVGFSVYFYNDIRDLEDDLKIKELSSQTQVGRASAPLGIGKISKSRLGKFALFSAIFGLLVALTINMQVFTLQLAYIVLGILYSTDPVKLKKRFLMKQTTIGAGLMIAHLTGGFAVGVINTPILFLMAVSAAMTIGINPLVDLRDIRGDRITGVKTVPVVWGPEMTVRLSLGVLVAIGAAYVVGYYGLGLNIAAPILGTIIVVTGFYIVFPLLKRWGNLVYLNRVLYRRILPLYISLQFVVLLGFLPITFF